MAADQRAALASIRTLPQLIAYLRDEMNWPIARDSFEDVDDLFYDFTADELGIDLKNAAKIQEIKRLRPLVANQPWGIFFVKFEPKRLPVVALRRILSQVALKKRPSANKADQAAWAEDDLLFVSNHGAGDERQISFAHFSAPADGHDLPTLKVLGWDNRDTALHLDAVAKELTERLAWPRDDHDLAAWREQWRAAFTLRHREVIATSKDLALRLAELARAIRDRITTAIAIETDKGPLTELMKAFQEALVHDLDADGFADMYAQTIAYGLLSARIANPHKKTAHDFAAHMRSNPFLRELMETFLTVGGQRGKAGATSIDFDELGISEVVDLLDNANMEAVVRDFGDRNPEEDPVIHFYEFFLGVYDKEQKVQRGVFYTPRPVVSYIVRSVDELLRTDFGLQDGLADTTTWGEMSERHQDLSVPDDVSPDDAFVQILDPATGTGTFLVEIVDVIHKTLKAKWMAEGHGPERLEALWNEYVPKHLLNRLNAYELLMAPYAIAHLKVGLKLYETGYDFAGGAARVNVFLTNSLEPAQDFSDRLAFAIPALAHEAQAVNEVKRGRRFTVVVGNPPYSGRSYNLTASARAMVNRYKTIDGQRIVEKGALQLEKNLNDDYVKFICLTQQLTEGHPCAVGLITNHSFLENPTLRGLRWHMITQYQWMHLLDLGGNVARREKGDDDNVFDIAQGAAISILATPPAPVRAQIEVGRLRGKRTDKYAALIAGKATIEFKSAIPVGPLYLFRSEDPERRAEYQRGLPLSTLFPLNSTGVKTHRDGFCIDFDLEPLRRRILDLISSELSDADIRDRYGLEDTHGWTLRNCRARLRADPNWEEAFARVLYRPFDWRHIYFSPHVVELARMEVSQHFLGGGNIGLVFMRQVASDEPYSHFAVTRSPVESRCFYSNRGTMSFAPLYLASPRAGGVLLGRNSGAELRPNLDRAMALELSGGRPSEDFGPIDSDTLLSYMYAVFHSRLYRSRYAEFLKTDFPRVPVPRSPELVRDLAPLGTALIALHLLEGPLTAGLPTYIGPVRTIAFRASWSDETVWIDPPGARGSGQTGPEGSGFQGVAQEVWDFQMGGYKVCEKWLKDRRGRALSDTDVAHYKKIVSAIVETIRIMGEVDRTIDGHGGWPGAFDTDDVRAELRRVAESASPFVPLDRPAGEV